MSSPHGGGSRTAWQLSSCLSARFRRELGQAAAPGSLAAAIPGGQHLLPAGGVAARASVEPSPGWRRCQRQRPAWGSRQAAFLSCLRLLAGGREPAGKGFLPGCAGGWGSVGHGLGFSVPPLCCLFQGLRAAGSPLPVSRWVGGCAGAPRGQPGLVSGEAGQFLREAAAGEARGAPPAPVSRASCGWKCQVLLVHV